MIGNATPAWDELVHPGAAGYALVSGAATFAWSLTPAWLGTHTWGSGLNLLPTDATGQALGAVGTRWDLHTQDVYFEGATGNNVVTITDNLADALHVVDTGDGDIFLQIVTTTGSEETILNAGGDDVDFTVQAVGVADALQVRGSDGQITLGVLTAGFVKSSAGGVLSVALEVALAELAGYVRGSIIRGGAADWEALAHPGAAGYALISDATDIVWDQTPAWTGEHSFGAGIAFTGASGANETTVPDNTAIALELLDTGGLEYMRIVSTNANPYFLIDPAWAGINVGIRVVAPGCALDVRGLSLVFRATEESAATNSPRNFFQGHTRSTGDMVDGFGPQMLFSIEDNASVVNYIGIINLLRDGADNSGKFKIATYNAGVQNVGLVMDHLGHVGVNTPIPSDNLDVKMGAVDAYSGIQISAPNTTGGGSTPALVLDRGAGATQVKIYSIGDATTAQIRFQVDNGAGPFDIATISTGGRWGMMTTVPAGQLHVDQSAASGAIPVLVLDQADLSEEFIDLITTVGAGNPVQTGAVGAYYGKMRIAVNGTFKYMPLYNS